MRFPRLLQFLAVASLFIPLAAAAETLEGTLRRIVVDPADNEAAREEFLLERPSGTVHLSIADSKLARRAENAVGRVVSVETPDRPVGLSRSTPRRVTAIETAPMLPQGLDEQSNAAPSRRIIFISFTLPDAPRAVDLAAVDAALGDFADINSMYGEVTGGAVQFDASRTYAGPFSLSGSISDCEGSGYLVGDGDGGVMGWAVAAERAAAAGGIDLARFDHVVFLLPEGSKCPFAGLGDLLGRRVWITGGGAVPRVIAHELGHNLGLSHSSADSNDDGTVDPAGEYGDPFCVMGAGNLERGFSPAHPQVRRWIESKGGTMQVIDEPGEYLVDIDRFDDGFSPEDVLIVRAPGAPDDLFLYAEQYYEQFVSPEGRFTQDTTPRTGVILSKFGRTAADTERSRFIRKLNSAGRYADDARGVEIEVLETAPDFARIRVVIGADERRTDGTSSVTKTVAPGGKPTVKILSRSQRGKRVVVSGLVSSKDIESASVSARVRSPSQPFSSASSLTLVPTENEDVLQWSYTFRAKKPGTYRIEITAETAGAAPVVVRVRKPVED